MRSVIPLRSYRCGRCRQLGHNVSTCTQPPAPTISRQRHYQMRQKQYGFCHACPNTVVARRIYDPDTGLVLDDRPLTHCAVHWTRSNVGYLRRKVPR